MDCGSLLAERSKPIFTSPCSRPCDSGTASGSDEMLDSSRLPQSKSFHFLGSSMGTILQRIHPRESGSEEKDLRRIEHPHENDDE